GADSRDQPPTNATLASACADSHLHPDEVRLSMNDRDAQWHDVYRVDLDSGERTLVEENTGEFAGYMADADYEVRLAMRARPDGGQDVLRRDDDGQWQVVEEIPFEAYLTTSYAGFTTDGETVYLRESRDRNTVGLYAIEVDSGQRELVFEDPRADISNALADPRSGEI